MKKKFLLLWSGRRRNLIFFVFGFSETGKTREVVIRSNLISIRYKTGGKRKRRCLSFSFTIRAKFGSLEVFSYFFEKWGENMGGAPPWVFSLPLACLNWRWYVFQERLNIIPHSHLVGVSNFWARGRMGDDSTYVGACPAGPALNLECRHDFPQMRKWENCEGKFFICTVSQTRTRERVSCIPVSSPEACFFLRPVKIAGEEACWIISEAWFFTGIRVHLMESSPCLWGGLVR